MKAQAQQTAESSNPQTHTDTTQAKSTSPSSKVTVGETTRLIVQILYWLVVAAAVWFAYLNVAPYAAAVKFVMSNTMDTALMQLLLRLPLIGAVVKFASLGAHWIIGLVVWAAIQTIEIFPIVLKHDRSFMRTVISDQENSQKFALKSEDDPAVRLLKQWYNRFPMLTVTKARNFALFVYAIDFCICLLVYPPSDGGFSDFFFLLMTGQFMAFDWVNIALLMVTLYAIEAIVHLLFFLGQILWYYRLSRA
jgi:hypothetical protein